MSKKVSTPAAVRADIYEAVTGTIVAALEQAASPTEWPWIKSAAQGVAEIGSAFLCGDLGIVPQPRADNVEYVRHWLAVLKGDKKAVFTAASLSRKASEYLHAMQPVALAKAA